MAKVYAAMINETQKLLGQRTAMAYLLLSLLMPLGFGLLFSSVQSSTAIQILAGSNFSSAMLWMYTSYCLPLFVMMIATNLFVGEVADRSLKLVLMRPISRFKVFLSKTLVIGLFIVAGLALTCVAAILSGGIFLKEWNIDEWMRMIGQYCAAAFPMFVLGMFTVFVGQFFRSVSGAFLLCIVLYGAAKLLPFIIPSISGILFTTYTDWHSMWLGGSVTVGRLLLITLILLSYCVLFFSGGYYRFEKKDL